jgi:rod shape-determining protein MreC
VPAYASPAPPRTGDVAGTLRLLAYLALAIALVVLDHRGGWLSQVRAQANTAIQPLWWLAGLPARLGDSVRDDAATRSQLSEENSRLRNALLVGSARQARLQVSAAENERLRGLLGTTERNRLDVQLAPILDIDLDPTRQRLILKAGSRDGVRLGQSVIDAGGLVGQIIEVTPNTATVLLITDPDHAVPVVVARNGVRLIAYGKGRSDQLDLTNIPLSGDVKVGDAIVTSGLGGRFPPGFPVGTVAALRPDDSRAFLVGELKPAAQLDRGRDVLLLRNVVVAPTPGSVAPAVPASDGNNVDATSAKPAANAATATHPARPRATPSTPPSTRARTDGVAGPSVNPPTNPPTNPAGAKSATAGASTPAAVEPQR